MVCRIIREKPEQRNFNSPPFLERIGSAGAEPWVGKTLDVPRLIEKLVELLSKEDLLWINLLDKLYRYAPEDKGVKNLVRCFSS